MIKTAHNNSIFAVVGVEALALRVAHQQLTGRSSNAAGLSYVCTFRPMPANHHRYEADFFTATCLEWKRLLRPAKYKDIVASSLQFLSHAGRVKVYGFVIMDNHLHLIWHICHPHRQQDVQRDFLKYTAQQIKADLLKHHPQVLPQFLVEAKDRRYQFWERNPLSVPIWTAEVMAQKLNYIHENPVRAGLCEVAADYYYSSAGFYEDSEDKFGFLMDYRF